MHAILGRVPSAHMLKAAMRAGGALDVTGTPTAVARYSYSRLPTGGMYHYEDLIKGEQLLVESGLVRQVDDVLYPSERLRHVLGLQEEDACEVLMSVVLSEHPPLWVHAAVSQGEVSAELISDADDDALAEAIPDPARREALLLALGRRYVAENDIELGRIGEELVEAGCRSQLVAAGKPELAERVQRVSLISDQLGYDVVAPTLAGTSHRIEVKTTRTATEVIGVTISRNEAEVGLRDTSWALVVCRAVHERCPGIVGWCRGDVLRAVLPIDTDPRARWMSAVVTLQLGCLTPGLPPP